MELRYTSLSIAACPYLNCILKFFFQHILHIWSHQLSEIRPLSRNKFSLFQTVTWKDVSEAASPGPHSGQQHTIRSPLFFLWAGAIRVWVRGLILLRLLLGDGGHGGGSRWRHWGRTLRLPLCVPQLESTHTYIMLPLVKSACNYIYRNMVKQSFLLLKG